MQVKAQAQAEGLDQIFSERRSRLARSWLLHVHRDERRSTATRRIQRLDQQSQFRRPSRQRWTNVLSESPHRCSKAPSLGVITERLRIKGHLMVLLTSKTVVLRVDNVDTDQIIPARFLKPSPKRARRPAFLRTGATMPRALRTPRLYPQLPMPLKAPRYWSRADNFGCGSSREHALGRWIAVRIQSRRQHFLCRHF